jgi:hypothetical protein
VPDGGRLADALAAEFGAERGDEVVEVLLGGRLANVLNRGRGQLRATRSPELLPPSNRDPLAHQSRDEWSPYTGGQAGSQKEKDRIFIFLRRGRRDLPYPAANGPAIVTICCRALAEGPCFSVSMVPARPGGPDSREEDEWA